MKKTNNLHVVINQSLTGTLCMRVWRVIIAVRIKGGRGNNVQFMATNDDVLFPREIAW